MSAKHDARDFLHRFAMCERGATAIEYGLILALIFLVILGAYTQIAANATAKMKAANDAIVAAG